MKYVHTQIVFQEVPDHISLALHISGCPLRCKGCHSSDFWNSGLGSDLSAEELQKLINKYRGAISCVLFLGGEWHPERLVSLLQICQEQGLKTCLYTGEDEISSSISRHLNYLKTGPWIKERGGLNHRNTNQKFIDLSNGQVLNYLFQRGEKEL